jgi:hypothetical protein
MKILEILAYIGYFIGCPGKTYGLGWISDALRRKIYECVFLS